MSNTVKRRNSRIELKPLSPALGVEVHGVESVAEMDDATFEDVRAAFLAHSVVVFRDQNITPEEQKAFSRRFGELMPVPFVKTLDEHPEIIGVIKEADERTDNVFGGGWHSDFSFLGEPPLASCLYAIETPETGGDTLFASTRKAYLGLSDGLKETLARMRIIHSGARSYGVRGRFSHDQLRSIPVQPSAAGDEEVPHPVVRTLPETGEKCLFVNAGYSVRFEEMSADESAPLLNYLYEQICKPENTCRLVWNPGTLTVWDNRAVLHNAINDYDGHRRELHRTTIAGERPI